MTTNTAGVASGKKRVLVTIGGLVVAAGITAGVFATAGGSEQQDRTQVEADEASRDSSRSDRGSRAKATKADPTSSSVDAATATASEAAPDGGAADTGTAASDTTTTGATASATKASAAGGQTAPAGSGGTSTGAAAGSATGGSSGGSTGGSAGGSTGGSAGGSGGSPASNGGTGGTGGGTTGGAGIAPPVTQAPAPPVTQAPAPPAAECIAGGANSNAVAVAQRFCDHRAGRGLAVMTRNSRMDAAAQARAERMASSGVIDHAGYEDQVRAACGGCTHVGENLANWSTVAEAWSFWLGSSAHAPNLNRPGAGEFGVGAAPRADGTIVLVHMFGWY